MLQSTGSQSWIRLSDLTTTAVSKSHSGVSGQQFLLGNVVTFALCTDALNKVLLPPSCENLRPSGVGTRVDFLLPCPDAFDKPARLR